MGSSVQELWLGDSNITSIDQNDFKTLTNAVVVNLKYCNIQFVSKGTFSKLYKLQYLIISWNPLTLEAVTNTFCSLPQSSQELNVTLKGIFEKEVSEKFPNLKLLKCLGLRNITTLDLSDNMLGVSHIQSIFCASNRTVSNYILNGMTLVDPLRIRGNVFKCFQGVDINSISLTANVLSDVSNNSFTHLTYLKSLDLSECEAARHITSIGAFRELSNLTQLILGQNNFRNFAVFSNAPKGALDQLELLSINKNNFLRFGSFSCDAFQSLQTLDISGNIPRLELIPNKFIYNLASLRTIKLNQLTFVRLRGNPFYSGSLQNIEMEYMEISITQISSEIFQNITNLKSISLEALNSKPRYREVYNYETGLEHFLFYAFQNLPKLTNLNLKSVGMRTLKSEMFSGTDNLSCLNLQSNRIYQIFEGSISHLSQLTLLQLDHNSIASLNASVLPQPENQLNISAPFNTWNCDCSLLWFLNLMRNRKSSKFRISGQKNYICHSPSYVVDLKVTKYQPSKHECVFNPLTSTYFIMLYTSVSLVVILLFVSTVFRFRWHIYFAYINTKARIRGYKELNDPREYEYDAFVAYNRDDTNWVTGYLRKVLEKQNKLKLCLHDRDWLGGIDIVDNIQQSIDKSRKVVLIITNAFARSNWCQLELTMAQHRLFSEDRDNLILVMKEKILDCNMTPRLALQLKTQTYIEWDESEMGQKVFWKRLVNSTRGPAASVRNKPIIN